ncbi:hypothetical protein NPIL_242021 [Nephila pilipes]|uniref:Uncharacterized protein n=1 Tax=Nephila pilipes TaxID=299642 RepID=A0A8X6U4D1_NEPPI|nr:hypothetical protein NPIL_242021 [Nephila pilipes]
MLSTSLRLSERQLIFIDSQTARVRAHGERYINIYIRKERQGNLRIFVELSPAHAALGWGGSFSPLWTGPSLAWKPGLSRGRGHSSVRTLG